MKEHPILFSTDMVKAIQDGTKTQTRRVIKPQPYQSYNSLSWDGNEKSGSGRGTGLIGTDEEGLKKWLPLVSPYIDHSVNIKPIPDMSNYGAGDDGNIYRIDKPKPTALKPWVGGYKDGYQVVRINSHNEYIHQLVCKAFYGLPPKEMPDTRHLDGNSLNNRPQNLDWGTPKQNALDRYAHGKLSGGNHPRARLSVDTANEIRLRRKDFTIPELAQRYDVSKGTIEKVIYGQTWKADVQPAPPNMERYVKSLGRLWVRETWASSEVMNYIYFKADGGGLPSNLKWKPSIHMFRKDSRITLEVTEVRVERVTEISEEDAIAEGCVPTEDVPFEPPLIFRTLWDSLNAKRGYGWEINPWIWVISYETKST